MKITTYTIDGIIDADPVLKSFRNAEYGYWLPEHQIKIKIAVSKIAFSIWLDYNY